LLRRWRDRRCADTGRTSMRVSIRGSSGGVQAVAGCSRLPTGNYGEMRIETPIKADPRDPTRTASHLLPYSPCAGDLRSDRTSDEQTGNQPAARDTTGRTCRSSAPRAPNGSIPLADESVRTRFRPHAGPRCEAPDLVATWTSPLGPRHPPSGERYS
jgi:hypothetical protein